MIVKRFTVIELLVAVGIMMVFSSALAYAYTTTAQLTSGQIFTARVNSKAHYVLDSIGENLSGLRSHDIPGQTNVGLLGRYLDSYEKKLDVNKGTPYLALVSFQNQSKTLKEHAYYTIFNKNTGYYDAYKSDLAELGREDSLFNEDRDDLFAPDNLVRSKIAENVIFMKFSYWNDDPNGGSNEFIHNSSEGPTTVEVVISIAPSVGPGRWEGELVSLSGTECVIDRLNGAFPSVTSNTEGYLQFGEGLEGNVFKYNKVEQVEDRYTFSGGNSPGLEMPSGQKGDSVIVGQTFKRSYVLR